VFSFGEYGRIEKKPVKTIKQNKHEQKSRQEKKINFHEQNPR
jgi:hypothetical protein